METAAVMDPGSSTDCDPLSLQRSDRLYQVSVGQCLSVAQPLGPKGYVSMAICDSGAQQKWQLMG